MWGGQGRSKKLYRHHQCVFGKLSVNTRSTVSPTTGYMCFVGRDTGFERKAFVMSEHRKSQLWVAVIVLSFGTIAEAQNPPPAQFRIATFSADVTVPIGHRCMGVLPTKVTRIKDPLEAFGFVLLGPDQPIVVVAVDWCEIRNGAYDQWRESLAKAAGTKRERVLVTSLHQHDAPVTDAGAAALLNKVGLQGELYDEEFHALCIKRTAAALKKSLESSQRLTHLGTGQAVVENIASNRRVQREGRPASFDRGSRSGGDEFHRNAPVGLIDRNLKTVSFWSSDRPVVALSVYATHPMSYYGRGEVSADFVGLARRQRQLDLPDVMQIYASGCSGDVTAGKYNDGSEKSRQQLVARLHAAMLAAWENTRKVPLTEISLRDTELFLEYYDHKDLKPKNLQAVLDNESARTEDRILAAMSLSSHQRNTAKQAIDFPCVDFGSAQLLLFPGEAFVGYQLMAQQMKPNSFVVSMGYGECWPGYIPTKAAFVDGFHDKWLWVAPGSEARIRKALTTVLNVD